MQATGDVRRIGRYEIGELLGRGGEGLVHAAVLCGPGGLRKPVALKLLHGDGRGLRREARLGGLLRHPHLVDVFEVGEDDGAWFCAMELCDGGSLARRAPLSPRAVVDVGLQVCDALGYAHAELGLVHLDLKPANLLIHRGRVKVSDLGISVARGFTSDGRIRGSRGFMAPEQAAGRAVDRRTDIYALGHTLQALATGRRPSVVHTLDAWGERDAAPEEAPPWLATVVARCTEHDPADRYDSMEEVAAALRELRAEGPGLLALFPVPSPTTPAATNLASDDAPWVARDALESRVIEGLTPGAVQVLKGPGGIGKTRLGRRVAWRRHQESSVPAWFCDLSACWTAEDAVGAMSATLDLAGPFRTRAQRAEVVRGALAARGSAVWVLDNAEQVADLAPLLATWVAAAPQSSWLVTSRAPVGVDGEVVVEVEPLDEADGVRLAVARARQRGVALDDDPRLVELVRRLDGIPLAIELAVGRLGVLDVGEVLDALGPSLLRSGDVDAPDRHATVEALVRWSLNLLTPEQCACLAALSFFRAPFAPEAAEAVLSADHVLDLVAALVDRSVLQVRDGRLQMLELVRVQASELPFDRAAVELRHGAWFARLGDPSLLDGLETRDAAPTRQRLERALPDLLYAGRRAVARGDAGVARATSRAALAVYAVVGPFDAAVELAFETLAVADDTTRAELLLQAGRSLALAGRASEALPYLADCLALADGAGEPFPSRVSVAAVGALATALVNLGRHDEAAALSRDHLEQARRAGDVQAIARLAVNVGVAVHQARPEDAQRSYEEAIEGARALGLARPEAVALGNLGNLHREHGRFVEAAAAYEAALAIHQANGNRRSEAVVLGNLALLNADEGREEAGNYFAVAVARLREVGDRQHLANVLLNYGHACWDAGSVEEARRSWLELLEVVSTGEHPISETIACVNLALLTLGEGDLDRARAWHLRAAKAVTRTRSDLWSTIVTIEGARLRAWDGDVMGAVGVLEEQVARIQATSAAIAARVLPTRALMLAHLGRLSEAGEDLRLAEELTPSGNASMTATLACACAEIAGASARDDADRALALGLLDRAEAAVAATRARRGSPLVRDLDHARRAVEGRPDRGCRF